MIDTYLKSKNREALEHLLDFAINVIGPVQGTAASEGLVLEDGTMIEAQEAKGDPTYWYACIRFLLPITPSGEIESCDEETGRAVCGVWA